MTCPGERALGIAFSNGAEPELGGHIRICARCAARWEGLARLRGLARELPAPALGEGARQQIRASLFAAGGVPLRRPRRWPFAIAGCVGVAAVAVSFLALRGPAAPQSHATVHAMAGTLFAREGSLEDEILHLHDGAVTLDVRPLHHGERFRVVTQDAEIEVRGTSFQVIADGDRLVAVWVARGVVEVRPNGLPAATLRAGESWDRPPPLLAAAAPAPPAPSPPAASVASRAPRHSHPRPAPEALPAPPKVPEEPPPLPARTAGEPSTSGASAAERDFDEGFDALRGGDAARAAVVFERAAGGDDQLAEDAAFWRAVALRRAGRPAQALSAFIAYLSRFPASARAGEAAVAAGWLALDAGRPDDAAAYFEKGTYDPDAAIRAGAADGLRAVEARRTE